MTGPSRGKEAGKNTVLCLTYAWEDHACLVGRKTLSDEWRSRPSQHEGHEPGALSFRALAVSSLPMKALNQKSGLVNAHETTQTAISALKAHVCIEHTF